MGLTFSLGDVVEVQLPPATTHPTQQNGMHFPHTAPLLAHLGALEPPKHKGFGFVTFTSPSDAQDAIDNMDLNELKGRVIRVNLARPIKVQLQANSNRASK